MPRKRVLIIEADRDFAEGLSRTLKSEGYGTIFAGDGTEGLDIVRGDRPDLIVLCVELPQMSGYSVCNKLKKDSALKSIPLIIISSEATPETFQQHKKLKTHAEDYMIKPFKSEELVEKIKTLIGEAGADGQEPEEIELQISDDSIVEEAPMEAAPATPVSAPVSARVEAVPPPFEASQPRDKADVFREDDLGALDTAFGKLSEKGAEEAQVSGIEAGAASMATAAIMSENASLKEQLGAARRELALTRSQIEDSGRRSKPPSPRENEEITRLRNELRSKEVLLKDEMDKRNKLDEKVAELISELGEKHDEILNLHEQIARNQKDSDEKATVLLEQVSALNTSVESIRSDKEGLESRLKSVEYLIKKRDDDINHKASQISELAEKVSELQNEANRLIPFEMESTQLRTEIEGLRERIADVEEESRRNKENHSSAMRKLSDEAALRHKAASAVEAALQLLREKVEIGD
jgi:CheY-like chemotaxis protein